MGEQFNGASAIRPGPNSPSAVRRVLILGYSDGATDGVMELGHRREVFAFRQTKEEYNADGLDVRTFELQPLGPNTIDELVNAISPFIEPTWPTWTPIWQFPDEQTRLAVDAEVDAILATAGPPVWEIVTDDHIAFSHFQANRLSPEPATRG